MVPRILAILAALLAVPLGAPAAAQEEKQIIVYTRGKVLQYDPDAGADLKEVILETYDCRQGALVKTETLETYFHLSEDREIITPASICDECRRRFVIEKRDDKYFFGGVRERPAETADEVAAATAAAPPISPAESAENLREKVRKVAAEIVKVDARKKDSARLRSKIITGEFTSSFQGFGPAELEKIAGFVTGESDLSANQKYYVLRSFGYAFYERRDWDKAIFFYDRCIELAPENYTGWFQKAVALDRADRFDDAIRAYAKALSLKPDRRIAAYFAALARRAGRTERLGEAEVADLRAAIGTVDAALRRGDAARAKDEADALLRVVRGWYGDRDDRAAAGGAAPAPPPAPPPPVDPAAPEGEW